MGQPKIIEAKALDLDIRKTNFFKEDPDSLWCEIDDMCRRIEIIPI